MNSAMGSAMGSRVGSTVCSTMSTAINSAMTSGTSAGFTLGDIRIGRVEDKLGPALEPKVMFPAFRDELWEAERHWLAPAHFTPDGARLRTSNHSWVVNTGRHTVLIDTCIGNDKHRPQSPHHHMRDVPWLERLAQAGVAPEQVDFVLCTHLHADHVGWNTRLEDGHWVPTFPNARYLFGRTEFERWDTRRADHQRLRFNDFVFDDSILPVAESGQMQLVDDGYAIDDALSVEASPGHTQGHVSIRAASRGASGVFCGDIVHHPIQILHPDLCSSFDDDQALALRTRLALFARCAEDGALLMPTHFSEPHCCRIADAGGRYAIDWNWGAHASP